MLVFIIRRLLQAIPILLGVSQVVFDLVHIVPGKPIDLLMAPEASPEAIAQIKARSASTSRSTSNISAGGSAMAAILTQLSSTRPNNWNGPSAKIWRRCFASPPGLAGTSRAATTTR
jgi:Binding-prot-dependent transport system membrane comp, N-term